MMNDSREAEQISGEAKSNNQAAQSDETTAYAVSDVESRHTPTPWHVEDRYTSDIAIHDKNWHTIARIRQHKDAEVDKANAAFIVKACNAFDEFVSALKFYADLNEGTWEQCDDDNEHGLRRCYITGTCHPREVARRALAMIEPQSSDSAAIAEGCTPAK